MNNNNSALFFKFIFQKRGSIRQPYELLIQENNDPNGYQKVFIDETIGKNFN